MPMLMLPGGSPARRSTGAEAVLPQKPTRQLLGRQHILGALGHNASSTFCGMRLGSYSANLLDLLGALGHNASSTSSPSLFARGSLGAAPDTVWGLVLCRGDADDCSTCVTTAGREAGRLCNRSRGLALLYEKCFVRISPNQSILDPASSYMDGSTGIGIANLFWLLISTGTETQKIFLAATSRRARPLVSSPTSTTP